MPHALCATPVRLAALALVATLASAGPGWAADLSARVDRVYSTGSYIHVLLTVTNNTPTAVDVAVNCSVFDQSKTALGVANDYIDKLPAGEPAVAEVLVRSPPNADGTGMSAICRARAR